MGKRNINLSKNEINKTNLKNNTTEIVYRARKMKFSQIQRKMILT